MSVYMEPGGGSRRALDTLFFVAYVWGCAIFAVVFYGVDSVNREGEIDLDNRENFQWLHGAGWRIIYQWVPEMYKHVRDNYNTEFKSRTRFQFLVVFVVVNFAMSSFPFVMGEFPSVLLFIFLANVAMYLGFYVAMKRLAKERLTWPPLVFSILAALFMAPALYFFQAEVKKTGDGPDAAALSKDHNQECFVDPGLNYFDNHDVWHFLSSFGLFFSLSFLLTLDDDIADEDQDNIQVW